MTNGFGSRQSFWLEPDTYTTTLSSFLEQVRENQGRWPAVYCLRQAFIVLNRAIEPDSFIVKAK